MIEKKNVSRGFLDKDVAFHVVPIRAISGLSRMSNKFFRQMCDLGKQKD